MKIIRGHLPEGAAWRVLLYLDPKHPSPLLWQLGLTLAQANKGEMIPVLFLAEESEPQADPQALFPEVADTPSTNVDIYPVIIVTSNFSESVNHLIKEIGADLLLVPARMDCLSYHNCFQSTWREK